MSVHEVGLCTISQVWHFHLLNNSMHTQIFFEIVNESIRNKKKQESIQVDGA